MVALFGLRSFLLKSTPTGDTRDHSLRRLRWVMRQVDVEIVKRSDAAKGFRVLPKCWIVERTIRWLNRCRRLAKDWEYLN